MEQFDVTTIYGGEVKALEGGKVGGYLVTFSDENSTDLSGDFFTRSTDFGPHMTSPTLYNHGLDVKIGAKILGQAQMKIDDLGVWIEAQLEMRDKYEKAIYQLAKKGKLGWSSGTASHLVQREQKGSANHITSWPLGLDASLTPTPAEPRNQAMSLKSIETTDLELETEAEDEVIVAEVESKQQTTQPVKVKPMEEEVKKVEEKKTNEANEQAAPINVKSFSSIVEKIGEELDADAKKKAMETKAAQEMEEGLKELLNKAMTAAPPVNGGGSAALNLKTKRGDDALKAFNHFLKTGDNGGLRANPEYKTDYNLVEGTQYQGQELVPTEIAKMVYELRDPQSIARAAGATVLQVNSSAVNVPFEKNRQGVFVAPGETVAYDQLENQPFNKLAVTITKYTRNVPISEELLEDSVVDLVPFIVAHAARALANTENVHFITGTTGAWYGSAKGLDFDSATAIGVGEPIELLGSLNAEYRDQIAWVGTKATESQIRLLNTAYSFPYIGNGGASGFVGQGNTGGGGFAGGSLLGGRFYNCAGVDEIGASKKSLMVGNFAAGYVICERRALTIRRDESSLSSGLVKMLFSTRIGGGITISEAFAHGLHPSA